MEPITLSESNYDFSEKFLSIAEKYFNLTDTSTLKVGMFGYSTEIMALIARDAVFHRNFTFNEFFPNTINLHSSIYNWAKILEEPVTFAQPSKLQALLTIKLDTIVGNTIKINRKTIFSIDKYKFLLPYDLIINITTTSITAIYDISDGNANYKDVEIKSPYLKVIVNGNDIQILITLYNLEIKEYIFNILSDDIIERNVFDITFKNNLASFNVLYKENQTNTKFIYIPALFNDIADSALVRNAFYTPLNVDSLRIYFSTKPGFFSPSFNSQVKVELFSTLGGLGNFKYNGNIAMTNTDNSFKYTIVALTDAIGGTDSTSLQDMKLKVITKLRSRKSINTTYDLSDVFNTLRDNSVISGVELAAFKSRDDFIARSYSIYAMIRNSNNVVVPTNTIDMEFTIDELESSDVNFTIKPGTIIIYDTRESKYRLLERGEVPDYYMNNKNVYLFSVPFLMNIDFKEFPKVNFYNTNYSKSYEMFYDYVKTSSPYDTVINSINIERNSLVNMNSFRVSTILNSVKLLSDLDNSLVNAKIRLVLNQSSSSIGYIDLERDGSTNTFFTDITTNDEFNSDGAFILGDVFRDNSGIILNGVTLYGDITMSLGILIESNLSLPPELGFEFSNMGDLSNYILLAKLSPRQEIALVDDLSDVLYSPIHINQDTGIIKISKIPVISSLFMLNNKLSSDINTYIDKILVSLRNIVAFLDNNTSLNVKFFNTSGISKNFSIDTVDISLDLQMKLSVPANSVLDSKIKLYIVELIEKTNSQSEKRFALSNLFTSLENKFSEILYIKFSSINKTNTQSITSLPMNLSTKNYVPEYLTVRKVNGSDIVDSDYVYDINIAYL